MNKKGNSFSIWLEVVLFSILIVVCLTFISTSMNGLYNDNKDLSYGIITQSTQDSLSNLTADLAIDTQGQSSFGTLGVLVLITLPKILLNLLSVILGFVTGAWIGTLIGLMGLGEYTNIVAIIFRILYILMVIFIFLRLFTRSNDI